MQKILAYLQGSAVAFLLLVTLGVVCVGGTFAGMGAGSTHRVTWWMLGATSTMTALRLLYYRQRPRYVNSPYTLGRLGLNLMLPLFLPVSWAMVLTDTGLIVNRFVALLVAGGVLVAGCVGWTSYWNARAHS